MPHDTSLITTIVAALVLAYVFGAIAHRLKMPPLVGYLIAGICVGPHSPGFVADQTLAPQLAEIGVILLMFGVGLHFSLRDLLSVRAIAVPGALLQMAVATALGLGLALMLGWSIGGGIVFGLALSVSSTVVLLKALQDRHLIDSDRGRIAVGWLIVEDLAMVLALVLIPALAGVMGGPAATAVGAIHTATSDPFVAVTEQVLHMHLPLWGVLGVTVVKLLAFVGFMIVVGRRIIPFILHATAHTGSRELFRLAVLAIALGVAAGAAYLFGVSLALGAFFAGMILSESELSHRAAQETLPLRDAFGVLFFVSVGMLFDPAIIINNPVPVIATLLIVLFGKSLVGFLLLVVLRRPVAAALTISAALAQIGEFSFILAALGVSLGLLPAEGQGLILAGAIVSIILNPAMFWLSERLRPRLEARASRRTEPELGPVVPDRAEAAAAEPAADGEVLEEVAQPTHLSNHVVLIGYGRVGSVVAEELVEERQPFVLIEDAEGRVLKAREADIEVIVANAATSEALRLANVMGARCVIIAIPNAFEAGQATEQCRKLNAAVRIIARAHSDEEVEYLRHLGADEVIMGEREIGLGMIGWLNGDGLRKQSAQNSGSSEAETTVQQTGDEQPAQTADQPGPSGTAVALALPIAFVVPAEELATESEEPRPAPETILLAPTPPADEPPAKAPPELLQTINLPWLTSEDHDLMGTAASIEPPAEVSATEPQAEPAPPPYVVTAAPAPAAMSEPVPEPAQPTSFQPAVHEAVVREDEAPEAVSVASAAWPADAELPAEADAPRPVGFAEASLAAFGGVPRPGSVSFAAEPDSTATAYTAGESAFRQAASPPEEITAARETEAPARPAAERVSDFRVVPPADIVILPPEPSARTGNWGAADDKAAAEEAPQPFRSEFWADPAPEEEGAVPVETVHPMRDVHAAEAARAAIEDGSWIAALERDLFGYGGSAAAPPAASEPTEPPSPPEEPMPPPPPTEPPQPPEDPQPVPQPVETPEPQEIPIPAPQPSPVPPVTPEPRADESPAPVDAFGRREPRLY